jgi:hypothetical protein
LGGLNAEKKESLSIIHEIFVEKIKILAVKLMQKVEAYENASEKNMLNAFIRNVVGISNDAGMQPMFQEMTHLTKQVKKVKGVVKFDYPKWNDLKIKR